MEGRTVTTRDSGPSVGLVSLLAVVVIAALVGLFVWQPWNGTSVQRTDTTTTQQSTNADNGTDTGTGTANAGAGTTNAAAGASGAATNH